MNTYNQLAGLEVNFVADKDHKTAKALEQKYNPFQVKDSVDIDRHLLADRIYSQALRILNDANQPETHVSLQRANILRDQGFNMLRWGLLYIDEPYEDFEVAEEKFELSNTLLNVSLDITNQTLDKGIMRGFNSRQDKELLSIHGKTLGYMARYVTTMWSYGWIKDNNPKFPEGIIQKDHMSSLYVMSEKFLRQSGDHYAIASNRARWARQERLNGNNYATRILARKALGSIGVNEVIDLKRNYNVMKSAINLMTIWNKEQAFDATLYLP